MLVFTLDPATIVLLLTFITFLQTLVLVLFYYLLASRYRGLAIWAWSSGLNAAGLCLIFVRTPLSDLLTIAANGMLIGAAALTLLGVSAFLGRLTRAQVGLSLALVAGVILLCVPLTYSVPDTNTRIAIVSLATATLIGVSAWRLATEAPPRLRLSFWFTATVFGMNAIWNLFRAALAIIGAGDGSVFSLDRQLGNVLVSFAVQLLWVAGILAMTTQRLLSELHQARDGERATFEAAAIDANRRAAETRELLDALTAANAIIREREQIFRLTFDCSPLGAALIAPSGRFLRVNGALCATSGYSEAELLRLNIFKLIHPDDHSRAEAHGRALLGGSERSSLETKARRADGATIWLRTTVGPVSDGDGKPLHFLALVEDISARKDQELHLRTVERQMQLVLRTIPDQFWLKDAAGRYLLASHSLANFYGRRPEEFVGRTVAELHGHELAAMISGSDRSVLSEGQTRVTELAMADAGGEQRWVNITRAPVYDDDHTLVGVVGVARDITAAKAGEAALRQSRERLELALWGAEMGLWDWHIANGTLETDAQLARLFGREPDQLPTSQAAWVSFAKAELHPADRQVLHEAFEAVIAGEADGVDVEFRVRLAPDSWRWCGSRGRVVERDAANMPVRLVGIVRDITRRREAQDRLSEREELLRSVSDNLPDGLIYQMERMPDGSARFRYLSAGVERLWGVTAEEVYADPERVWARWHPDDRAAFERTARQANRQASLFEFEGRVCLPDGTTRWSYSRSSPQLLPDGRLLRSGVELDVTARKRAEAELRRRIEALQTLNDIGQALTSWTTIADALETVGSLLQRLFKTEAVTIWEYDEATAGLRPLLPPAGQGLKGRQFDRSWLGDSTVTMLELPPGHPLVGLSGGGEQLHQSLLLGLRSRNATIGLLCISAASPAEGFSPEDVALSQTVASLLASALENGRLFAHAQSTAAEQERRRLARELHDSVSQALFAANRTAELLPQLWELDPDEGRSALADLRRFTEGALAEMRALLVELRPRALVEASLDETLSFLLPAAAARGGAQVSHRLGQAPPLPPEVQVALYRIAQEALNNASRHARASAIDVTLTVEPPYVAGEPWHGSVCLKVCDNGRGFDPRSGVVGHFGLQSMRERASEIGATLMLTSAHGKGAAIGVTWHGVAQIQEEEEVTA